MIQFNEVRSATGSYWLYRSVILHAIVVVCVFGERRDGGLYCASFSIIPIKH